MTGLADRLRALLAAGTPSILVTVTESKGSAPREARARMLVGPEDIAGTIGGGKLEWLAIKRARELLHDASAEGAMDLALGAALGQSCGGRVELTLRFADGAVLDALSALEAAARVRRPDVYVFGIGHVGGTLLRALAPLPFAVRAVDGRPGMLDALPEGVEGIATDDPVAVVRDGPADAAYVAMSHTHALDYAIVGAALRRGDAAYVGMLGSETKRARFARGFLAQGGDEATLARLISPIGGKVLRDKRPEVISALVAAELAVALLAEPAAEVAA